MKTFNEWIKIKEQEQMHMGRPNGPMGPDGKVYGWSGGPASQIQGTGTWKSGQSSVATGRQLPAPPLPTQPPKPNSQPTNNKDEKEAEGLWRANNGVVRGGYLSGVNNYQQFLNKDWQQLPPEVKEMAKKSMFSRSPFGK
jgi:hypothetical protein